MNDRGLCPLCTSSHVELRRHSFAGPGVLYADGRTTAGFCLRPLHLLRFYYPSPLSYHIPLRAPCTLYTPRRIEFRCPRAARMLSRNGRRTWNGVGPRRHRRRFRHPPSSPSKAMSSFPDYYAILSVPRTATTEEIRTAYKKESLRYAATPLPQPC